MSKRRRFRRAFVILVLLVLILAGGWTAAWYLLAGRLADHLAAWEQQAAGAGFVIRHDPPVRTGWPMAAGIRLTHVSVEVPHADLPGGAVWQAAQVTLALDIRHANDLFIGIDGRQSVTVGRNPPIAFQAQRMSALAAVLPGDRLGLIQGNATAILAAWPAGDWPATSGRMLPVSIGTMAAALNVTGDGTAVAVQLHDIGLPRSHMAALGNPTLLTFDAVLSGAAADRRLDLRAFHLDDGPLALGAIGQFSMASDRKPRGALTVMARGLDESLQKLAAAKVMTHAEARAMTAVASLVMAQNRAAPFTLDDGLVSLGTIPLFRWPQ